jgi:hypothetical protein
VKHPYLVAAASAVCVLAGLVGLMVHSGKAAVASFVLAAAPLLSGLARLISKCSWPRGRGGLQSKRLK